MMITSCVELEERGWEKWVSVCRSRMLGDDELSASGVADHISKVSSGVKHSVFLVYGNGGRRWVVAQSRSPLAGVFWFLFVATTIALGYLSGDYLSWWSIVPGLFGFAAIQHSDYTWFGTMYLGLRRNGYKGSIRRVPKSEVIEGLSSGSWRVVE